MRTLSEINRCLQEISEKINATTLELEGAREEYLNKKALYENEFSRYLLLTKLEHSDWTDTRIKAQATNLAHNDRMELIKAESKYKKLTNQLKALNRELDALREESYNVRAEVNKFK